MVNYTWIRHYLEAWQRYFEWSGRTSRKAYWQFMLVHIFISWWLLIVDLSHTSNSVLTLDLFYGVMSFVPAVTASIRRMNDTDRSAGWLCLYLLPIVGWVVVFYFLLQPGQRPKSNCNGSQGVTL